MKIRRSFRIAGLLAVIVSCAVYVGVGAAQAIDDEETVIARMHDSLVGRARVRNGWRLTDTPRGTGGVFMMQLSDGEWRENDLPVQDSVIVAVIDDAASWGLFHITRESRELKLRIEGLPASPAMQDEFESVRLLQELNRMHPDRVLAGAVSAYAKDETSYTRTLWLGVLGDLSILAAFAAIIFSLVKLRREVRWRRPGHCTECDYDLAGLAADTCPECGAAANPAPSPQAPQGKYTENAEGSQRTQSEPPKS
ncbi:MAG: hypothetical protein KF869_01475 [Phycisphaeraceae bacterium]|nr:hypothetical protein [Phycisphaeraceae bacterium]